MASLQDEEEDLDLAIAMSLEQNLDDKEPGILADGGKPLIEHDGDSDEDLALAFAMSLQQVSDDDAGSIPADQDEGPALPATMPLHADAVLREDTAISKTSNLEEDMQEGTRDPVLRALLPKRRANRRAVNIASINMGNISRMPDAITAVRRLDDQLLESSAFPKLMVFASNPLYTTFGNTLIEDSSQLLHLLEGLRIEFESNPTEEQWYHLKIASFVYFELYLLNQHDREASASYMEQAFLKLRQAGQQAPQGILPYQVEHLFTLTEFLAEDARHAVDLRTCSSYIELTHLWDAQLQMEGPAGMFRPLYLGYALEQLHRVYRPSSSIAVDILEKMISYGEECYELSSKIAQDAQWDKRVILLCYSKLERAQGSRDAMSIADLDEAIGYTTEELLFMDGDPPPPKDILLVIAFNAWLCRYSRERDAYNMLRALEAGFTTLDYIGISHRNSDHVIRALAALLDEQSQDSKLILYLSKSVDMALRLQDVRAGMLQSPTHQQNDAQCASCNQHLTKRDRVLCEQCKLCSYCRTCAVPVGFSHLEHCSDDLMVDVFGKLALVELDITVSRFTSLASTAPSNITASAGHADSGEPADVTQPPPNKGKEKALCHADFTLLALQRYELRSKHHSILKSPPSDELDEHDRAFYILECHIITGNEVARAKTMFHLRAAPKKPLPAGVTRPVLLLELANMGIRLYERRKEEEVRNIVWDLAFEAFGLVRDNDALRQEQLSCALVMTWFIRESRLLRSGNQDALIAQEWTFARLAWQVLTPLKDGPIVSAICYIGLAEVFVTMYWAKKTWRNLINTDTWAEISMHQLSQIPPDHPAFRDCHLSVACILRNASAVLKDGAAELKTDPPADPLPEGFGDLDWIRPADVLSSDHPPQAAMGQYLATRAGAKCRSSVDILKQFIEDPDADVAHQVSYLISSAQSFREIFMQSQDRTFLLKSIQTYQQCLKIQSQQPTEHMRAAVELANLLSTYGLSGEHLDVVAALAKAITVPVQLISHNMSTEDQQLNLLAVHGFANTVAALHLRNGQVIEALSVLERGRNLMTNRIIDTRISVEEQGSELEQVYDLLSKFRDLQEAVVREIDLDPTDLAFRRRREANPDHAYMMELEMGWKRMEAREELEKVAEKLRRHPRYADCLDSPGPNVMKGMANDGPIFVINVTASRCDTVVITASSITSVHLDELLLETVELKRRKMEQITNDSEPRNWALNNKEFSSILSWLWNTVVKPSWKEAKLRHPYTDSSTSALPRAWWIAGGPLEWAPLHVAGKFDGKSSKNNMTKLAISSYTPSIRALQYSRQREHGLMQRITDNSILVVTMETTPGESALPGARQEAEAIIKRAKDANIPYDILRHKSAHEVLRQIQHHSIVHFACHGVVDRRSPSSSSLLLQRTIDNTFSEQRFSRVVQCIGGAGVGTLNISECKKGRLHSFHAFSTYDEQQIPLAAKNGRLVLGVMTTPGYSGLPFDSNIPAQKDLLRVSGLAALSLKPAYPRYIAFLSACHSAFALSKVVPQGRYLEETISIAAGFHLAGFRHVIGSLWNAKDEACVRISDSFYKTLFDGDREPRDSDVAQALQMAVLDLITEEPMQPLLWAPFIHIGT